MGKFLLYVAGGFFIFVFVCLFALLVTYLGQHKDQKDNDVSDYHGNVIN